MVLMNNQRTPTTASCLPNRRSIAPTENGGKKNSFSDGNFYESHWPPELFYDRHPATDDKQKTSSDDGKPFPEFEIIPDDELDDDLNWYRRRKN